jgi:hypothetical protein
VNHEQAYDITHYINDREFAVSTIFLSLIRSALGTALNGKPKVEYEKYVSQRLEFDTSFRRFLKAHNDSASCGFTATRLSNNS